jgi:hypothetical protein
LYDPLTKRFIAKDEAGYSKISEPVTLNLYMYGSQNPLTNVDPTGRAGERVADSNRSRGYYTQWRAGGSKNSSTNTVYKYANQGGVVKTLREGTEYEIRSDIAYYKAGYGPEPVRAKIIDSYPSGLYKITFSGAVPNSTIIISKEGYQSITIREQAEYAVGSNGTGSWNPGYGYKPLLTIAPGKQFPI